MMTDVQPERSIAERVTVAFEAGIIEGQRGAKKEALEAAAQLCEDYIREFRGMAEDGDHFDTLPAKIRAL